MSNLPKTFKAAVLKSKNAPLTIEDVELKLPGPGEVLVKVLACGVCHSDNFMQEGHLGEPFPIIPGHEIIGDAVAVGDRVTRFKVGDRVGGPWHGGHDATCRSCQRGMYQCCDNAVINGVTKDGGYAEYCTLRAEAAVPIPKDVDPAETAPLLCAGVTVFNAIRKMGVEQGELVAVQGLGGLGHLGVQYARAMGYRVVALSRGDDKRDFAKQLGAQMFIDTGKGDVASQLQELGGAALIVSTAPNPDAVAPLVHGLQPRGKLLVLAPVGPIPIDSTALVIKGISVHGWPSGHALDSEEAIQFATATGVKCMIEKRKLADANQALIEVGEGKPRFRNVLVME